MLDQSPVTSVTFENASPKNHSLRATLFRGPDADGEVMHEDGFYNENYVDLALIELAFAPWTYPVKNSKAQAIMIRPKEAPEALARFQAFAEMPNDAFNHTYDHTQIVDALNTCITSGATLWAVQDQ